MGQHQSQLKLQKIHNTPTVKNGYNKILTCHSNTSSWVCLCNTINENEICWKLVVNFSNKQRHLMNNYNSYFCHRSKSDIM